MNKEGLIRYIKENDKFYQFANMSQYSQKLLLEVKQRIDGQKWVDQMHIRPFKKK
jgi:hypothetical protein